MDTGQMDVGQNHLRKVAKQIAAMPDVPPNTLPVVDMPPAVEPPQPQEKPLPGKIPPAIKMPDPSGDDLPPGTIPPPLEISLHLPPSSEKQSSEHNKDVIREFIEHMASQ